jgi:hypothetical protein
MPSLGDLVPRRLILFGREYRKSLLFAYSSPISSFLWILSVIPGTKSVTFPYSSQVYWGLVALALLSIAGPMGVYWYRNRPFHVVMEWKPIEPESIDHRLEQKNMLRLRVTDGSEIESAKALISVFFEKGTKQYRLKLDSAGPLVVVPQNAPGKSRYEEDERMLVCDDVELTRFIFPVEIQKEDGQSGALEQHVYIKDALNGDKTILHMEVV